MSIANNIKELVDQVSGKIITYWSGVNDDDGTAMTDAKTDGYIFRKLGSIYLRLAEPKKVKLSIYGNLENLATATRIPNKIIIVDNDYNLQGDNVTLPAGLTLQFDGGSFYNGTLTGNSTKIIAGREYIFKTDLILAGSFEFGRVLPEWFGASATAGQTSNRNAIQRAFDAPGLEPIKLSQTYPITGTGAYCLLLSKNRNIYGTNQRTCIIRSDSAGATTSIIKIAIDATNGNGGFIGDARSLELSNFTAFHNAGGATALEIDCTPFVGLSSIHSGTFHHLTLTANEDNGGYSIVAKGSLAFSDIYNCELGSGIALGTGIEAQRIADGNRIYNNNITGKHVGIYLDILLGSYKTQIINNVITNRDGAVRIRNGQQVDIVRNQIEQFPGYGPNTSPYGAHIWVEGVDYFSKDINIEGNNFGGGGNAQNLVVLDNCQDSIIQKNRFNPGTASEVYLLAASKGNKIYFDNKSDVPDRDDMFNLSVQDLGIGNFGTLQQSVAFGTFTSFLFYKDPASGEVIFRSNFSGPGGSSPSSTKMGELPNGFRPLENSYILTRNAVAPMILYIGTNGDIFNDQAITDNTFIGKGVRFAAAKPV